MRRAVVAVCVVAALTVAGAPRIADAQAPTNLLPNPSFESPNGSSPQGWEKQDPADPYGLAAYIQSNPSLAHTGSASVSSDLKCVDEGGHFGMGLNFWVNFSNLAPLPDATQPLVLSEWVQFQSTGPPRAGDEALFLTYFFDSGYNLIDWDSINVSLAGSWNSWLQLTTSLRPGIDIPAGAKYFSLMLGIQPDNYTSEQYVCTSASTLFTVFFDDVEALNSPPSVGGVAQQPDLPASMVGHGRLSYGTAALAVGVLALVGVGGWWVQRRRAA